MKLLRYGPVGQERPGLPDGDGTRRGISSFASDITGKALSPAHLSALAALDPQSLPLVGSRPRLGAPIGHIGKFIPPRLNDAAPAPEPNAPPPYPVYHKPGDVMTLGSNNRGGRAQTVVAGEKAAERPAT